MKKWMFFAACAAILIVFMTGCVDKNSFEPQEEEHAELRKFGLFSWYTEIMEEEERPVWEECIAQADISAIYQCFSEDSLLPQEGKAAAFVAGMLERDVEVYALMGEAEWAVDEKCEGLLENMRCVAEYNSIYKESSPIRGVMVDVEPYLLDDWQEGKEARQKLMERYLHNMKTAYDYAVQNTLEFWVCIPTFFDRTNRDILEELIADGCDGIAVMNYNRADEYGQIAMEVGFAREYGKGIICIYELQEAGRHGLEEINTYAYESLDVLWESANRLERQFGYSGLQFAYHYYEPLKALLNKEKFEEENTDE